MKVGIITFHQAVNYGAVLQAYALNKAVLSMGKECEIVDYRNGNFEKIYKKIDWKNSRTVRQLVSACIYGKLRNKKRELFDEFLKRYCVLSEENYNTETVSNIKTKYDVIITGSDQVWNLNLTGGDYHYYLDFCDDSVRKCSYAASIATKRFEENELVRIKKLLQDFSCITMRENTGKKYIETLVDGKDVKVVLDPSLLLKKEQWLDIASENILNKKLPPKFILAYFISPKENHYIAARDMGKLMGLPVVLINYSHRRVNGMINLRSVSPGEFVYIFSKTAFVITNSFHGTAFSVNLEKNFVFMLNENEPEKNERIETLIDLLGLEKRNWKSYRKGDEIDWKMVGCKLTDLRNESFAELKKEVQGD